ncbi:Type II DNA topoisomerase VI, subunit A (Top6A), partial [mine drainage metagenome]
MSEKVQDSKGKLESLAGGIIRDIKSGRNPKFITLARKRSNIVYDSKVGYLKLGKSREERDFINVAQSKRFMQTIAIAAKCHKFVSENLHTTIRGLFYQLKYSLGEDVDENIFNEQSESNPLIEDL